MRFLLIVALIGIGFLSCKSTTNTATANNERLENAVDNDTVSISSDESDYEIIIIEPGFNGWLASTARPRGYYSQVFMEQRNILYVREWNLRNMQPSRFNPNLYELRIDYDSRTDYGYEVNYMLYNYFIYFQLKYNQRLTSLVPRI